MFRHREDILLAGVVTVGEIRQAQGRTEVVVNSGKGYMLQELLKQSSFRHLI